MRKKIIFFIGVFIVLLISIITYFKPLSFSNIVSENNQINMILQKFDVKDGKAYNESVEYNDIIMEQKSAILALLEKYNYRRTIVTLFSNGSISNIGDKMLSVFVNDNNVSFNNVIVVTSSEKITINDKSYYMKNAEQFIEQVIEILEQ